MNRMGKCTSTYINSAHMSLNNHPYVVKLFMVCEMSMLILILQHIPLKWGFNYSCSRCLHIPCLASSPSHKPCKKAVVAGPYFTPGMSEYLVIVRHYLQCHPAVGQLEYVQIRNTKYLQTQLVFLYKRPNESLHPLHHVSPGPSQKQRMHM